MTGGVNWNSLYSNQGVRFTGNPALADLQQRVAQQQKQRQLDEANMNAQLAKINFGGSKDADFNHLHDQYGKILQTNMQLRGTNDPRERAQLALQLQQQQNGLMYDISKSKEAHQQEIKKADIVNNPNAELSNDFHKNWQDLNATSSFDPSYQTKQQTLAGNMFVPKWDALKESDQIAKQLIKPGTATSVQKFDPLTGHMMNTVTTPTLFDKDAFITAYAQNAMKHPGAIRDAQQATGESDPASAILGQAKILADYHGSAIAPKVEQKTLPQTIQSRKDMLEYGAMMRQKYHVDPAASVTPPTPPKDINIQFKNPGIGGAPMNVNFKQYRAVSIPKATIIPTSGFDDSGAKIKIPAGEVRVIGYADAPVSNKTGQLVQPEFEQAHPNDVTTQPIAHIQIDHKGKTRNFYIDPTAVNVNNSGQKQQTKAVNRANGVVEKTPTISSQADYNALPKGSQYVAPDGKIYIKK